MSAVLSVRVDDETLALVDQLCERRGNNRGQLVAHALDRVLAGHGLLDAVLIPERRVGHGATGSPRSTHLRPARASCSPPSSHAS